MRALNWQKKVYCVAKKKTVCAYCGQRATTRDHVPPKILFAKPLPSDMLTVPSGVECNRKYQLHDEYIGNAILMRREIQDEPSVGDTVDKMMRALGRDSAAGLSHRLLDTVQRVDVNTAAGIFLGSGMAFVVDSGRLAFFVRRIIRGLFFTEYGYRVPERVRVGAAFGVDRNRDLAGRFLRYLRGQPVKTACGGAFSYVWNAAEDSPMSAVWVFAIHGKAVYGGLTVDSKIPSKQIQVNWGREDQPEVSA